MRNKCASMSHLLNGGAENAGLENILESDELRLKQPQTSTTVDVSELSENCVGLFRGVVCWGSKEAIAPSKKIYAVQNDPHASPRPCKTSSMPLCCLTVA